MRTSKYRVVFTFTTFIISAFILSVWLISPSAYANTLDYPSTFTITFSGPEETVINRGQWGLEWLPDGNLAFIRSGGNVNLWLAGGVITTGVRSTFLLQGTSFDSLTPHQTVNNYAVPVFTPRGSDFDRDYVGTGTVITASNGSDLLLFYHAEDHTCGSGGHEKISIGLARSSDGGVTWSRIGQVITGRDFASGCPSKFNGAGYPSVVISPDGQYLYLYYMDWWNTRSELGPDQTHLARALVSSDGVPGSWFKYKNGSFSQPGLGGDSDPVILRPEPVDMTVWIGNPNISFNKFLDRYLAILESHQGFHYSSSVDGINWGTPKLLWEFPINRQNLNPGDTWYSYASLISPDQNVQRVTSQTGYLYYALGIEAGPSHYMVRRSITITQFRLYLPIVKR